MKKQLLIPMLVIFLASCSTTTPQEDSKVRVLSNGAWAVKLPPSSSEATRKSHFQYYSAVHAKSINCRRYSSASLSVDVDEQAFQCDPNGSFITDDVLAIGKPFRVFSF